MFEILNTWQFHLGGYLIANVIFFQFYKSAIAQAKHDGAATILLQTVAGLSILLLAPFMPFVFPTNPAIVGLLVLACVFYAINDRLQTTARKHLEVSVFSILNQFLTIFLIIYGFTVFQEPVTGEKISGAMLILFGNILLFYKQGRFQINKYTILSLIASLTLATAITIDIGISEQFNLPFYIMLTLIIPGLFIALAERISVKKILKEYNHVSFRYYVITGAAWALSIFFALRSFQLGEVSIIVPLQATSVLLNVLVASFVHKESGYIFRKVLAAALVILGVYVTTLTL
jgi:drug/metabolite transporter (DMT)-like permease